MNVTYTKKLAASLPKGIGRMANQSTMTSLGNPRVLLSKPAMAALEETFRKNGSQGQVLFQQTMEAIRVSMEAGLRSVFWIAAITMLISFLLISTIPEIALDKEPEDAEAPAKVAVNAK
jgi:hypothetical protein